MANFSEKEKNQDLWEKLINQDLELHALEELAKLLHQAKAGEEHSKKQDQVVAEKRTGQIDHLFQHVIGRLKQESRRDAKELSKRLVALEKLEKGLAGFLVARIEAMDHRIYRLQLERSRLEKVIDQSSKTILGMLFQGVKSQYQLKNVKAELRTLHEEKQRIWQKKEVLNNIRASLLDRSKEGAHTVLQKAQLEGLDTLHDCLMSKIEQNVALAEATGDMAGLSLGETTSGRFGRFVKGLSVKEKAFIDRAGEAKSYAHGVQELVQELSDVLSDNHRDSGESVANRSLFLAKLLVNRRLESLLSGESCFILFRLVEQGKLGLVAVKEALDQLPMKTQQRLRQISSLVRRIEALNVETSGHMRRSLSRIFRDLLFRYSDIIAHLPDSERPAITERRRHSERVNRLLDELMQFFVDHMESL